MSTLRFKGNELPLDVVGEFLSKEEHQRYTAIDLPSKKISDDTAMLLNSLAMRCRRLHTLKLGGNRISDMGAESLAKAMPHFPSDITHLDLSGNKITSRGAGEITGAFLREQVGGGSSSRARPTEESLRETGGVRLLDLSHNPLEDAGVEAVARHLRKRVRLRLRGVGCGKYGLQKLLAQKEALHELDLGMNPLGVVGVNGLCRAVQSARDWHRLNISSLQGFGEGLHLDALAGVATPLSACLRSAHRLRELDCGGNGLGDAGAKQVVEAMAELQPGGLELLALGHSACGIMTANALQAALSKRAAGTSASSSAGLQVLDLEGNHLNEECMAVFAEGLSKSFTLLRLFLARNRITSAGAKHLASGLQRQRKNRDLPPGRQAACVVELDLSFNPIDDEGAEALARAAAESSADADARTFKAPWGLEILNLSETCISESGGMSLCGAVAARAALADAAAYDLEKNPDDAMLRSLRDRRVRRPNGFQVVGLSLDDAPAATLRKDAESKLQALWPEPEPVAADEAAGASLCVSPIRSVESTAFDEDTQEGGPKSQSDGKMKAGSQASTAATSSQASTAATSSGVSIVHMPFAESEETKVVHCRQAGGQGQGSAADAVGWISSNLSRLFGGAEAVPEQARLEDSPMSSGADSPDGTALWYADETSHAPHTIGGSSMLGNSEERSPRRRPVAESAPLPAELPREASSSSRAPSPRAAAAQGTSFASEEAPSALAPPRRSPRSAMVSLDGTPAGRRGHEVLPAEFSISTPTSAEPTAREASPARPPGLLASACVPASVLDMQDSPTAAAAQPGRADVSPSLTDTHDNTSIIQAKLKDGPVAGLKEVYIDAAHLKEAGIDAGQLRRAGLSLEQLRQAGFEASDLQKAGFASGELTETSVGAGQLNDAGSIARPLKEDDIDAGCLRLKEAGIDAGQLRQAGFTGEQLWRAGFDAVELQAAGFNSAELEEARSAAEQLKEGHTSDASTVTGRTSDASTIVSLTSGTNSVPQAGAPSELDPAAAAAVSRCACGGELPPAALFCPRCGTRCSEAGRRAAEEWMQAVHPAHPTLSEDNIPLRRVDLFGGKAEGEGGTAGGSGLGGGDESGGGASCAAGQATAAAASPAPAASGKGKGKAKGPPPPAPPPKGKGKTKQASQPAPESEGSKAEGEESAKAGPPPPNQAEGAASPGGKGGKGGKGSPKGPAKGPGKGSPPPPGKAKSAAPALGKAKAAAKQAATPKFVGEAPFGRRMHWVGVNYEEPESSSVFGDLTSNVGFDSDLLKAMLSSEAKQKTASMRKSIAKKPQGIAVLDATRAQNIAIVLNKLQVNSQDFCKCLRDLDFSNDRISNDDVELLIQVLPTPDESKKLLEHQSKVDELRDVEQNVMPFCLLHKSVVRLKLMKFSKTHATNFVSLKQRCEVLKAAAEEVRSSAQFRELLGLILHVGNFINHGVQEVFAGTVRAFAIDSLSSLASFKTGAVSTLHFLCLSKFSSDPDFFKALKSGLANVHEAARETHALLKSTVEAFEKEVEFARLQAKTLLKPEEGEAGQDGPSPDVEERMRVLMGELDGETAELKGALAQATEACIDTQKYFAVSEKAQANLPPSEVFFGQIASFLDQLGAAWGEIQKNPSKWQQFADAAGSGSTKARRKSMPGIRLDAEGEGKDAGPKKSKICGSSIGATDGENGEQVRPRASSDAVYRRVSFAQGEGAETASEVPEEPSRSPSPEASPEATEAEGPKPPGKGKGKDKGKGKSKGRGVPPGPPPRPATAPAAAGGGECAEASAAKAPPAAKAAGPAKGKQKGKAPMSLADALMAAARKEESPVREGPPSSTLAEPAAASPSPARGDVEAASPSTVDLASPSRGEVTPPPKEPVVQTRSPESVASHQSRSPGWYPPSRQDSNDGPADAMAEPPKSQASPEPDVQLPARGDSAMTDVTLSTLSPASRLPSAKPSAQDLHDDT
eukprot:TRINITY_DN22228_c0_g1_i1.p1 TRINITY_DN22228_c0_g1~~TRINITY_DN22228_c0_g1_i1.p1  ORF type:complete len:1950 (+),score=485.05 TRINITY_DN22228_c0_g1_i1:66-5915(+)